MAAEGVGLLETKRGGIMRRRGRRRLLRSWGLLTFLLAVASGRAAAERMIWEETWRGEGDLELTRDVAIDGRSAIAVGKSSDALLGVGDELGVRAYDLKTGEFLWEDVVDSGSADEAVAVATARRVAVVVGTVGNATGEPSIAVRAYDPRTGTLLWHDDELPGTGAAVAALRRTVVAAGSAPSGDLEVQAYNVRTGAPRWDDGDSSLDLLYPYAVALSKEVAVVAGFVFVDPSDHDFALRAFAAETGAPLWDYQHALTPGNERAIDVVLGKGIGVAVGLTRDGAGAGRFTVRAFAAATGGLLWEDIQGPAAGNLSAFTAALGPDAVVVAGAKDGDLLVRTYDLGSGALLWDDVYAGSLGGVDVAVRGRTALVAGTDGFSIRAYDVRSGALLWEDARLEAAAAVAVRGATAVVGGTFWGPDYGYQVIRGYTLRGP
jgi:outer membrane protein assembly factor BamB